MRKLFYCLCLLNSASSFACDYKSIGFDAQFAAGRLNDCSQLSETHFELTFRPENKPINSSPWYAFQIDSQQTQNVVIDLNFSGYSARYLPKLSTDGSRWVPIPATLLDGKMRFQLNLPKGRVLVAAQELITSDWYENWLQTGDWANEQVITLGNSLKGRPIKAIESKQADSNQWMIIIGRQHPPEVTGAFAMKRFVETLFLDTALARQFLQHYNVLVVPDLNPDGVDNGHWRHNLNGTDLNRDWNKFNQPETRLVRDKLRDIQAKGGKIVFAVDFHSTHEDIFYTMPKDYGITPVTLIDDWLTDLQEITKNLYTVRVKPGTNPDSGVFKQYIADTFKANALTFELGDSTDRALIHMVSEQASNILMRKMLDTDFDKQN